MRIAILVVFVGLLSIAALPTAEAGETCVGGHNPNNGFWWTACVGVAYYCQGYAYWWDDGYHEQHSCVGTAILD